LARRISIRVVDIREYKQRTSRPSSPIVNDGLTVWITGHRIRKPLCFRWDNERRASSEAQFLINPAQAPRRFRYAACRQNRESDSTCAESEQVASDRVG
jgi:hypothetical protein